MEALLAFTIFGSVVWFYIILTIVLIALIASDIQEEWLAPLVIVGAFILINYFWGNIPIGKYLTWSNVGIYIGVGFIFSLIRTFFKGKELKREYESLQTLLSNPYEQSLQEYKSEFALKANVFRWWFMFPISIITWLFGSVFKDIWNYVYSKLATVYTKILNA